jgi:hypothetical protein
MALMLELMSENGNDNSVLQNIGNSYEDKWWECIRKLTVKINGIWH